MRNTAGRSSDRRLQPAARERVDPAQLRDGHSASRRHSKRNKPDPLGSFDAIILGDVGPADVSSEALGEARGLCRGTQGGRWFSASARGTGPRSAARRRPESSCRWSSRGLWRSMRNRAQADQAALPPGAVVRPLADGLERDSWPMLQLDLDREKNGAIWAGLPRIPWLVAGRAKPGATVLAAAGGDDSAAVIAAQPYGLGKVLWVGTDGTWRWRFRTGDRFPSSVLGASGALGGLGSDGGGQCIRAIRARQASLLKRGMA